MCSLPSKDSAAVSMPQPLQQPPAFTKEKADLAGKPQPKPRANLDLKRQKTLREDGLALIHQIRVGPILKGPAHRILKSLCRLVGED